MPSGSSRNSGNARLAIPSAGRKAATSAALWAVLIGRQGPTRAGVSISAPAGRGRACRGRRRIRHDQMRRAGGELVDLRTGHERVDLQGAALTDEDHVALGVPSRRRELLQQAGAVRSPGQENDRIGLRVRRLCPQTGHGDPNGPALGRSRFSATVRWPQSDPAPISNSGVRRDNRVKTGRGCVGCRRDLPLAASPC